jgi:hypothetical protein
MDLRYYNYISKKCVLFAAQVAMNLVSNTISGTQTVSCDDGFQLLSCGMDNSQTTTEEYFRYAIANNPTSCKCNATYGAKCFAWCTNAVSGFEIMTSPVTTGYFSVTCSAGKKVKEKFEFVRCHAVGV